MTEAEKRKKTLSLQAQIQSEMFSSSRTASLFTAANNAVDAALNHSLEVERTYNAMSKNGITVDDLIDAYNRGSQSALDFSTSFFFSAYAIALSEHGREVEEALNQTPMPRERGGFLIKPEQLSEMARRGITKRDLVKMERLGATETKKELGIERFIEVISKFEDERLVSRVREIMDEEISAADIMERCKDETGVDIEKELGLK